MDQLGQKVQDTHTSRVEELKHQANHDQVIEGLDRVQKSVVGSGLHQLAAMSVHEPKVTVLNHPESIKTPDVVLVVDALKQLIALEKSKRDVDLKPIIKQLVKLAPILEALPSKINIPEPREEVEVTNLDELTVILEDILAALKEDAVADKVAPIVNVPAPIVNVAQSDVDLSPLESAIESVRQAVDMIHIPEMPVDDDTAVIEAVLAVEESIRSLVFPIPNVATDPLIRYKAADEDTQTAITYFGLVDNNGGWVILKRDTTVATLVTDRYMSGSNSYATNWTNRGTLTYGYMFTALNG